MYFDKVKISELVEAYSIVSRDYLVVNKDDKQSSKLSFANFTDSFKSQNLTWTGNIVFTGQVVLPPEAETDPIFVGSPAFTITQEDIDRWNEAYGWGDHSVEGYLKAEDIPTGFLMPGDNVSLLFNDPPYVTKSELDAAIDGLDFVTLEEITNILDNGKYLKEGDPISLLDNDVPYLTETSLLCILNGFTQKCHPDPNSRGWLKRAVNGVPIDKVSELENDVPYLTQQDYETSSAHFLQRRNPITGDFRDDNVELANGMGYLEHTWDGDPLTDYDIEILSNVVASPSYDGEVLVREGSNWVNQDQSANLANLRFIGKINVELPYVSSEPGDIYIQHKDNGLTAYPGSGWVFINLPADGQVQNHTWMVALKDGTFALLGKWNDQLQSDWLTSDVWHPSFIRNKPTKLSDIDPLLPDVIGDGEIAVSGGNGITVTGDPGTANQEGPSDQEISVDFKPGGGIILDGDQITIDWNAFVGAGDILTVGSAHIDVTTEGADGALVPYANQFCDTKTTIKISDLFVDKVNNSAAQIAGMLARIEALELDLASTKQRVSDLENK